MFRLTHKEHRRIENKMTVVDENVNRKRRRKLIKKKKDENKTDLRRMDGWFQIEQNNFN